MCLAAERSRTGSSDQFVIGPLFQSGIRSASVSGRFGSSVCSTPKILRTNKPRVRAVFSPKELVVCSMLENNALAHNKNLVSVLDCGEAMSYRYRSASYRQIKNVLSMSQKIRLTCGGLIQGILNDPFRLRIQRTGCFIKQEYAGIRDDSTCDGNSLLLTTRQ
jgi:hypothetical protein